MHDHCKFQPRCKSLGILHICLLLMRLSSCVSEVYNLWLFLMELLKDLVMLLVSELISKNLKSFVWSWICRKGRGRSWKERLLCLTFTSLFYVLHGRKETHAIFSNKKQQVEQVVYHVMYLIENQVIDN